MAEDDSIAKVHPNTKHGFARTDEYKIWERMIARCHNPATKGFDRYGGRGIRVCDRWRESFTDFLTDVGKRPSKRHSLDRYPNNDGNYEPGNVRWATAVEQGRNMRSNHTLTHDGQTLTIAEWAEKLGLKRWTIHNRIKYGWPVDRILSPASDARERYLTFNDETLRMSEWSERFGIAISTLSVRLRQGWSVERALTEPVNPRRSESVKKRFSKS